MVSWKFHWMKISSDEVISAAEYFCDKWDVTRMEKYGDGKGGYVEK